MVFEGQNPFSLHMNGWIDRFPYVMNDTSSITKKMTPPPSWGFKSESVGGFLDGEG